MSRLSSSLRRRVQERAGRQCEYCRSLMDYTGHQFTIDHIVPRSQGGTDDFANLCFCCFWCNNHKQARTHVRDSRTGRLVTIFNPRTQRWADHFRWSKAFARIIGRTEIGRATVRGLRLNRPTLVQARQIWAHYKLHPPEES